MAHKIINLTAQTVGKNIAEAIVDAPRAQQFVFSNSYYLRQLVARVISQIHNHCVICKDSVSGSQREVLFYPFGQPTEITRLIQEEMAKVLSEKSGWSESVQGLDNPPVFYAVVNHDYRS